MIWYSYREPARIENILTAWRILARMKEEEKKPCKYAISRHRWWDTPWFRMGHFPFTCTSFLFSRSMYRTEHIAEWKMSMTLSTMSLCFFRFFWFLLLGTGPINVNRIPKTIQLFEPITRDDHHLSCWVFYTFRRAHFRAECDFVEKKYRISPKFNTRSWNREPTNVVSLSLKNDWTFSQFPHSFIQHSWNTLIKLLKSSFR